MVVARALTREGRRLLLGRGAAAGAVRRNRRAARAHAHRLRGLQLLALGLQRRGDHQLGPVELRDVLVAAGRHRRAQAAHEVERAVVLAGGADEDLLERAVLRRRDPRAAGQRRVERRHAPVEPAARRLVGARQRRADHHGVGAAGDGLGDVAAVAHAAVGDHADVLAGLEHVLRAGGGHVGDRGGLRDADAQDAARGARRARTDADEHARRAGAHEVQAGVVAGTAADDHGHRQIGDELLEVQRLGGLRDMLGGDDRALDDQDVEAGVEDLLVVLHDALGRERGGGDDALVLDLPDALDHEVLVDGRAIDLLHLARGDVLGQGGDALQLGVGVLVAGEDALEVQDGEAAELADDARGAGRHDAVHRRGEERQLEAVIPQLPGDVDVVGVTRAPGRHDRDVVESVGAAGLLPATDLDLHLRILGLGPDEKTPRVRGPGWAVRRDVAATLHAPQRVATRSYGTEPPRPVPAGFQLTSAGADSARTSTSASSRSTSRGSTRPAPRGWVDSAPHATP